jgi:hypothetical protein
MSDIYCPPAVTAVVHVEQAELTDAVIVSTSISRGYIDASVNDRTVVKISVARCRRWSSGAAGPGTYRFETSVKASTFDIVFY